MVEQIEQPVQGLQIGTDLLDLGANVAGQARGFKPRVTLGFNEQLSGFAGLDAELVLLEPRGDVGVGAGVHVGIDAQRHRRDSMQPFRLASDALQFCGAFDVEAADAQLQAQVDFGLGLAHPGKHHGLRKRPGRDDALQFAAGHDVEARTEFIHQAQYAEVRVGLDRIADFSGNFGECCLKPPVLGADAVRRIDVGGRAHGFGDAGKRNRASAERAALQLESH